MVLPININNMVIKQYIGQIGTAMKFGHKKISYSQTGEDIICQFWLNIQKGFYVDIGTNDAKVLNNTYLFYKKGWKGLCVEANPALFSKISKERSKDKVLNVGVSSSNSFLPFYIMDPDTLSTFSPTVKNRLLKAGYVLRKTINIKCMSLKNIFAKNKIREVDILSIDTEGTELNILKSNDWSMYRPKMIIIETVFHKPIIKNSQPIKKYLSKKGYYLFADTFINTIFASKEWLKANDITIL